MKTRFEILSLAALPAVARRLEDGRPMLVFAEDGRTLLAANAGGFARVGATTAEARRAVVGATVAGLDARLADRVARFAESAEVGASVAELQRYFQGFKPVLVQIGLEKVASPEAGVAVLLTFEAAGTRPAEAGDIGAALDGFTGADGLVAAFDAEGDVLAASGDHGVLDDAHEEIEAIVEAADHLPLHAATVEKAGTARDVAVVTVPGEGRVRRLLYVGGVRPAPATSSDEDTAVGLPHIETASAEDARDAHAAPAVAEMPLPVFDRDHLMSDVSTDAADAASAVDADGEPAPVEFLAEALPVDHPVVAVEPPSAVLLAGLETATPSQPYPAMTEAELGEAIGLATGRTTVDTPPETAPDGEPAAMPAAQGVAEPPSGFRFRPSDRTIKFAWQMDAERRFTFVSDPLASAVGPRAADIVGRTWMEVATAYGLDPDGGIARSLDRRDTWSGRTALWPVEGEALRVPVDLAALPAFGRSRNFEGYRGFGTIRANETVPDPTGLGLILAGAVAAPVEGAGSPAQPEVQIPSHAEVELTVPAGTADIGQATTANEAVALGALATAGVVGLAPAASSVVGHDVAEEHFAPEVPAVGLESGATDETASQAPAPSFPVGGEADVHHTEVSSAATALETDANASVHETVLVADEAAPSMAAVPSGTEAEVSCATGVAPAAAEPETPPHAESDASASGLAATPDGLASGQGNAVEAGAPGPEQTPAAGPTMPEPVVAPPRRGAIEVTMAAAFGFSSIRAPGAVPAASAAEPRRDAADDVVPPSEASMREDGAAPAETPQALVSDAGRASLVGTEASDAPAGEVETTVEAERESEGTAGTGAAGLDDAGDETAPAGLSPAAELNTGHDAAGAVSVEPSITPVADPAAAAHTIEIAAAEAGIAEVAAPGAGASEKTAPEATGSEASLSEPLAPGHDASPTTSHSGPAETSGAAAPAIDPAAATRVTTLPSKTGSKIVTLASATRLLPETNRLSGPERVAFRQIAEALGARIEGDEPAARAEAKPSADAPAHPVVAEPPVAAEATAPTAQDGGGADKALLQTMLAEPAAPLVSVTGGPAGHAEPAATSPSEAAPSSAEVAGSELTIAETSVEDAREHRADAEGGQAHDTRTAEAEPPITTPAEGMPDTLAHALDDAPTGFIGDAIPDSSDAVLAQAADPASPADAEDRSGAPEREPQATGPVSVETAGAPVALASVEEISPARPQDARLAEDQRPQDPRLAEDQPSQDAHRREHPRSQDARLLDRLPLAAAIIHDERIDYANDAFLKLLGYADLAELVGTGGLDAMFAGPHAARRSAGEGSQPIPVLAKDGSVVPVDAYLATVPWNGGTGLMLTLDRLDDRPSAPVAAEPAVGAVDTGGRALHDALDRVAELEAIVDTATDGVIMLAGDGTVLACNRAAEALFGMDRKEMVGKGLSGLLAPESRRSAMDYLDGLARNGVASVLNDGREVIGQVAPEGLIPLFMTIGRISAGDSAKFCAVLRDITQWKKSEEDLTAERKRAEEASVHKSDFLAKISHEIRTPLNAIIGFSEVMIDERFGAIGNDRYKDYLRDIHTSGTHIMSLINDLLDLSKVEAGKMDLRFEAVGLGELLAECVAIMQPQANRERIIIRTSLPASVPPVVADPRSVRQIVLNLLSNAVKFTPAGGQVIVSTSFEDTGEVVMRVRDTGYGMTEKEIETALEPFRQLHTARAKGAGTGLGLPLTKALTEANRASFKIDSAVNQGTLVTITFPVTRVLAN